VVVGIRGEHNLLFTAPFCESIGSGAYRMEAIAAASTHLSLKFDASEMTEVGAWRRDRFTIASSTSPYPDAEGCA
jgi:hypothetical protein